MLPQGEVSKKVLLSHANRQRALQKVFSDFATKYGAAARVGMKRSNRKGKASRHPLSSTTELLMGANCIKQVKDNLVETF
jgi:hypothetical protein